MEECGRGRREEGGIGEAERCQGRVRRRLGQGLELARCSSLPGWGEGLTHLTGTLPPPLVGLLPATRPRLTGDLEGVLPTTAGDLDEEEAATGCWEDILAVEMLKRH